MGKYYLGLDMGTSTVGWAVTDANYKLLRAKGKDLWGVREFEEAESAAGRRTFRISRRRRQREQVRVGLLKNYFADAIDAVDPNFYVRLENSKYHLEDKDEKVKSPNGIFADPEYTDKEYFEEYPTIFHLRQELIRNPEPHDVRLVFLALLNIYKHRGHFLNAGVSSDESVKMDEAFWRMSGLVEDMLDISFPSVDPEEISKILSDRNISRSQKAEKLSELLKIDKKQKEATMIIKTICGLKGDAKTMFRLEDLEEKVDIHFSAYGYDEKEPEIEAAIGSDLFELVCAMKTVYDIGSLAGILRGSDYLSEARVEDYKKHGSDLKLLKKLLKTYAKPEVYDKMFRSEENGSYSAYVNSVSYDDLYGQGEKSKHRRNMKGRKREDFYAFVKKVLGTVPDCEEKTFILTEIDHETFMPKQLTASNGVIPYQVHEKELKAILRNARNYLPFLNEVDETGLSVAEQIQQIFSFQIPYYIGPTTSKSKKDGGNGWVVRKEAGSVRPWNLEEKIDVKKTSEEFISRMLRKCTYISGETVMPKCSLMYESYCVLNEINNIRIDGERISVEIKQDIYNDLFKKGKKVTRKQLETYLLNRGLLKSSEQLTGIDIAINNSLASYGKFKAIFGEELETDAGKKKAEDIIFWCTIYGDSKNFLIQNIEEHYPEITKAQIKRITGIKFKDWGRFSKKFLELQGCEKGTGEVFSVWRALWETQNNLMELIHSEDFTFKEELEKLQKDAYGSLSELKPEDLNDFYFSAPVKKMIWQTLSLIKELEEVLGGAPDKIFIEMTRSDGEKGDKGRKDSRKKQLLDLYRNIKDSSQDWKGLIESSDKSGILRSKKMYLYLTQMGKDMYTGEPIDLDELFNNNIYDIDHIYPRHFVKDDSIHNNLVLVHKVKNAHKSDSYPLETSIRHNPKVEELWYSLRSKNLITEEKYRRLTGTKEFTEDQKAEFIARQLVETGQATKGVADLLKQALPESEIVYAKAGNVSEFRKKYDLLKSRLVNDFHHANDAYLNIVVGNVYLTKFTNNPRNFIRKEYMADRKKYNYNLGKMFDRDVVRGEVVAWVAEKDGVPGTIALVKKMMARNTPMITRQNFVGHGGIAEQTLYGHRQAKKEGYIALKSSDEKMSDVMKYGGFSSVSTAYFFLVEHDVKKKRVRTLESLPVYLKDKVECNPQELENYCRDELKLINFSVRLRKIKIQSLLKLNGFYLHISGRASNQITLRNAVSLCLEKKWITYIKKIEKYNESKILDDMITEELNNELYDELVEKHLNSIYKRRPNPVGKKLKEGREKFNKLTLQQQCEVIFQVLNLTILGVPVADLTLVGGAKKSGTIKINKDISKCSEILLISQSITGIYEGKPINLLTV